LIAQLRAERRVTFVVYRSRQGGGRGKGFCVTGHAHCHRDPSVQGASSVGEASRSLALGLTRRVALRRYGVAFSPRRVPLRASAHTNARFQAVARLGPCQLLLRLSLHYRIGLG